ncbi:hypothetical protein K9L05_00725 [Candidatus Babeliales bacterium]|nr:hypothetical protein [Candidatus Babeliales bacterium]MCF7899157.1 hypothetical protein [Candidatus Babeliales bacterium]
MKFIKKFKDVNLKDLNLVGGKNASLGEMIQQLGNKGIKIPDGFATTSDAYWFFLEKNNLKEKIKNLLSKVDLKKLDEFATICHEIRSLIRNAVLPEELEKEIRESYQDLEKQYGKLCSVAVRSSATAEDLPHASFAGQQDTFLNIQGEKELIIATLNSFASLFTNRAVSYRIGNNFDHMSIALSTGVQKMVRSDKACSGVMFTLDTESGFKDVVMINSSYGLGENIVKGAVNPDEFYVHKPTLEKGFKPLLKKRLGRKAKKMIFTEDEKNSTKNIDVPKLQRKLFSLTDQEILELAKQAVVIENHYSEVKSSWSPMDIEWAKDGLDGQLYIVQARPETVFSQKINELVVQEYVLQEKVSREKVLVTGKSVGRKIAAGKARVIKSAKFMDQVKEGDILVTDMTDPDWEPIMRKAGGIITNRGGRTCFSGDTILLTSKGFMKMMDIFNNFENLYVPSLNRISLKIEWKKILNCMKNDGDIVKVSISQTGRMKNNFLNLTEDHKMLTLDNMDLISKELYKIIEDREMILLAQKISKLKCKKKRDKKLAYILGAMSTDGSIYLSRTHGEVLLVQKPTKEKEKFIKTFCSYMEDFFKKRASISIKKKSSGSIRGKIVVGEANAYRFYSKKIAEEISEYKKKLVNILLEEEDDFILNFLGGVIDGDGTFDHKSGRIGIYCSDYSLLQAIMVSCLRLGIVPQVTNNRSIFHIQIVEKIDKILSCTNRVKGCSKRTKFGSRFFSSKQLFSSIKNLVNYKGRIKPFIDNNSLIDAKKISEFILPLLSGTKEKCKLETILDSDTRMQRVLLVSKIGFQDVYNIEVEDNHNYVVFTERYTPILVNNCHAAIVSREIGIPAIVGSNNATEKIKDGQLVTIDCSGGEIGYVYDGELEFKIEEIEIAKIPKVDVDIMMNVGNPDEAFRFSLLPNKGIGLARVEFIINSSIQIHPMALIDTNKIKDEHILKSIEDITIGYEDKKQFFVDKLAQEAGTIAAAFYPKPVVIRMSDFKSNEYAELIGGKSFEPIEENPMIGFRGASRYYNKMYQAAFELEVLAMKKIRDEMGFINVKLMIPFVRTVKEAKKVIELMQKYGLTQGKNNLEIYMMCEVPSNILLIDDFSKIFDGFSIGSNDLTQLTLAVDRDSSLIADLFDERDKAVKMFLKMAIDGAKRNNKKIGICGQAPSDYPDLAEFLVEAGIDSMSLTPDTVLKEFLLLGKK